MAPAFAAGLAVYHRLVLREAAATHRGARVLSPGHEADVASAVELVLAATGRFRIPEPIRAAHAATTALRLRIDPRLRPPRRCDYPDFVSGRRP